MHTHALLTGTEVHALLPRFRERYVVRTTRRQRVLGLRPGIVLAAGRADLADPCGCSLVVRYPQ